MTPLATTVLVPAMVATDAAAATAYTTASDMAAEPVEEAATSEGTWEAIPRPVSTRNGNGHGQMSLAKRFGQSTEARAYALEVLARQGVVRRDETSEPAETEETIIADYRLAQNLLRKFANYADHLAASLKDTSSPRSMVELRTMVRQVLAMEAVVLIKEAQQETSAKEQAARTVKRLLLLNLLKTRGMEFPVIASSEAMFEFAAEYLAATYAENETNLARGARVELEAVKRTEARVETFRICFAWSQKLFRNELGIFSRIVFENGFQNPRALLDAIEAQVRRAKEGLKDLKFRAWREPRPAAEAANVAAV